MSTSLAVVCNISVLEVKCCLMYELKKLSDYETTCFLLENSKGCNKDDANYSSALKSYSRFPIVQHEIEFCLIVLSYMCLYLICRYLKASVWKVKLQESPLVKQYVDHIKVQVTGMG